MLTRDDFAELLGERPMAVKHTAPVHTESLCETLITNLVEQHQAYATYLELANRQRLALMNRRLAENQDLNHESDLILNKLGALEERRGALTAEILGPRLAGAAPTPAKCEAIFPLVSPEQAVRLRDARDTLVATMGELRRVLAVNTALVDNGSKIIHTTIGIMTSVAGRTKADRMNTYTARGNVNIGKVQLRNLVNRSV